MRKPFDIGARVVFGIVIFVALAAAILARPPKSPNEFDQAYYLTVAYDIDHHGVFSNGLLDDVNSTVAVPPPGMFFGPLYPWLIAGVTRIDARFAGSVDCAVEANHGTRPDTECEFYVRPMHLIHALLLALGVLAVARAAEIMFARSMVFWLAGVLATGGLLAEADVFAFLMTESLTFCLYSLTMLAMVMGWTTARRRYFGMAGLGLGLLCLARFSFLVPALVMPVLIFLNARFIARPVSASHHSGASAATSALAFALAFLAIILPWATRNAISVGKFALTEEYGSSALIERLAFDRMTAREFLLAFPYCLPEVGPRVVDRAFGTDAMARFQYDLPDSFYMIGSSQRWALIAEHKRLDPIIGEVFRTEMKDNWWRYILVSLPLAWCGMWAGGWLSLLLVPMFTVTCVAAVRRAKPLLLLYAAPAVLMLGLHAALASHYTRYNLILTGPFCAAAAWLMVLIGASLRSRRRNPSPAWRSAPSATLELAATDMETRPEIRI
jgi:hypothetical protein